MKFQKIFNLFYYQTTNNCPSSKCLICNFFGEKIKYMFIYRKTAHHGMFLRQENVLKCLFTLKCNLPKYPLPLFGCKVCSYKTKTAKISMRLSTSAQRQAVLIPVAELSLSGYTPCSIPYKCPVLWGPHEVAPYRKRSRSL